GPLRGRAVGCDLRQRATGLFRVVPGALADAGLSRNGSESQPMLRRKSIGRYVGAFRVHTPPILSNCRCGFGHEELQEDFVCPRYFISIPAQLTVDPSPAS